MEERFKYLQHINLKELRDIGYLDGSFFDWREGMKDANELSKYIHLSKYSRWIEKDKRRETWEETVDRYISFFKKQTPQITEETWTEIKSSILNMEVLPSMRALMTAGKALEIDNAAGFNCSACAVDNPRVFDEAFYLLMCFHPDTLVLTKNGNKKISELIVGDEVKSYEEATKGYFWKQITNVIKTPSSHKNKIQIELENGQKIKCTDDHLWLTKNRGYVKAKELTTNDDLVSPKYTIYRIKNKEDGRSYIGFTKNPIYVRLGQHLAQAKHGRYKSHFYRAINKYGADCWEIEAIDVAIDKDQAAEKEIEWIAKLNTLSNGFNSTIGGEGANGCKRTEEQKKTMSENAYIRTDEHRENQRQVLLKAMPKINETRKTNEYKKKARERNLGEKNPMYGKELSDEVKEKIANSMTGELNHFYGKEHTEETRTLISSLAKERGIEGEKNPFFGKKHSQESRDKMSATKQQKKLMKVELDNEN
ncbi:MAG: NUMOD3 domain-containing DNA-binding protein [Minisyncoccota bacterium]